VLDFLKTTFDATDLEQLKTFVKRNLSIDERVYLEFESGNRTTKGHLAAIIKMALVLKKLSQDAPAVMIEEDDDEQTLFEKSVKQRADAEWGRFCNGKLRVFENKWTRKLESYNNGDEEEEEEEVFGQPPKGDTSADAPNKFRVRKDKRGGSRYQEQTPEESDDHEDQIKNLLTTGAFKKNLMEKRNKVNQRPSQEELDRARNEFDQDDEEEQSDEGLYWKLHVPEEKTEEHAFYDNQFWRKPDLLDSDLDALLREEGYDL